MADSERGPGQRPPQQKLLAWRILRIDELLQGGACRTAAWLSRQLEVTPRTIQRDIEYMRDFYAAPIQGTRGGYRYTEPAFFIKSIPLSEGEAFSLALLNPLLEQYRNTPLEQDLRAVFSKVAKSLPKSVSIDTSFLSDKITFIPDRTEPIAPELFRTVFTAVRLARTLRFCYRPLQKATYLERTLDPYHAVCQKGNWYVLGLDHDKGDVRIFSLGRMQDVRMTDGSFSVPAGFRPQDYFDAELGVWLSDRTPLTVELVVDKQIATYALTRTWHSGQVVQQRPDGSVYVRFQTTQKQEVLRWVLGQGHTVRVLAPPELVTAVREELDKTRGLYER